MIPKRVILHCSDTPDYTADHHHFDAIGLNEIDQWHRARGFDRAGYHWTIRRSGILEEGRPETALGAHCKGQNFDSIGVCYVGLHIPTQEQIDVIITLYALICQRWKITWENWYGHYEFNPDKDCPGFSMDLMRELLKRLPIQS